MPGSTRTSGRSAGTSTRIVLPPGPRSSSERAITSPRSAGLGKTDIAPAWSLLMSSRFSTSLMSLSSDSSAVASSSSWPSALHSTSRDRRLVTAALAAAHGARRARVPAAPCAGRVDKGLRGVLGGRDATRRRPEQVRLRAGPSCLLGPSRSVVHDHGYHDGHDYEHDQRQGIVGLVDVEGVKGRREVVVQEQ